MATEPPNDSPRGHITGECVTCGYTFTTDDALDAAELVTAHRRDCPESADAE